MTPRLASELLGLGRLETLEGRTTDILRLAEECAPGQAGAFLIGLGLGEWVFTRGWSDGEIRSLFEDSLAEIRKVEAEERQKGEPS